MLPSDKYRCPACGFAIHNRAYPRCERCQQPLPPELVFSKDEIERQWKAMQEERAKSLRLPDDAGGDVIGAIDF